MHDASTHVPRVDAELLPKLPVGKSWIPVQLGESGDRVYRRSDHEAYAKIGPIAALDDERLRMEWLSATGTHSPAVLDWTISSERACLLSSVIPGIPASTLTGDALRKAWPSIARQLKELHDLPVADCPFQRCLSVMFARAEDVVARKAVNRDFLAPTQRHLPPRDLLANIKRELPERLAQEPNDLVVCHGDACLPNFMVDPETLHCTGLLDLGRLGTADRYVDLALILGNSQETWLTTQDAHYARSLLFDLHTIPHPDERRLDFYLRLDPLTWG